MTGNHISVTGGCLCGAIRYEASESPIDAGICHCRTCQKSTGGAFMVIVGFSHSAFRFTKGEPKLYRSSAIMDKGFCPHCGSLLFDQYLVQTGNSTPEMIWLQLGTLDYPERASTHWHTGVESQLPWIRFDDGLPRRRCDEDPGMAAAFAAAETDEE